MEPNLIKITADKQKAKSILTMVETSLELLKTINEKKFASNALKDYYEILRELMSVILLLDGYKVYGEGAHMQLVTYIESRYKEVTLEEIKLIDRLRILRNKIAYDGFFVEPDYLASKKEAILIVIEKFREVIKNKMRQSQ